MPPFETKIFLILSIMPWPFYLLIVVIVVYKITNFKFTTATKIAFVTAFLVSLAIFFFESDVFSFIGKSLTIALTITLATHTITKRILANHPKRNISLSVGFVLFTILLIVVMPRMIMCTCAHMPVIHENIFSGECKVYDGAGCCSGDGSPWFMKRGCNDDLQMEQLKSQTILPTEIPL